MTLKGFLKGLKWLLKIKKNDQIILKVKKD